MYSLIKLLKNNEINPEEGKENPEGNNGILNEEHRMRGRGRVQRRLNEDMENVHIGQMSAPCVGSVSSSSWITESVFCRCVWKLSPKSILQQLSGSGRPPLPPRALHYFHQQKPRKGKEIFLVRLGQDKYFVFAGFPTSAAWSNQNEWIGAIRFRSPKEHEGLFLKSPHDNNTGR